MTSARWRRVEGPAGTRGARGAAPRNPDELPQAATQDLEDLHKEHLMPPRSHTTEGDHDNPHPPAPGSEPRPPEPELHSALVPLLWLLIPFVLIIIYGLLTASSAD